MKLPYVSVDPTSAWARRLDYRGIHERELAEFQARGTGNGGTKTQVIESQVLALRSCGPINRVFQPMCGVGRWAQAIARCSAAKSYLGTDISAEAIDIAKSCQYPGLAAAFDVADVLDEWPDEARTADAVLLTFEALNYFPPTHRQTIMESLGRLQRLKWLLINVRWPFPETKRPSIRMTTSAIHPLFAGNAFTVSLEVSRPIRARERVGVQDVLIGKRLRTGVRAAASALWKCDPVDVIAEVGQMGLKPIRHCKLDNSITMLFGGKAP